MPRRSASLSPAKRKPAETAEDLPLDVEISHRLIREIIDLKHSPGAWLREQEIAERFDVSRSPVREALRHVAKAGFVQMHPWRGAQIVELSEETTTEVFDMLEAIYGVVARVAAKNMPAEKMPFLRELLKRGEAFVKPGGTMRDRVAWSFEMGRYVGKWGTAPKTYEVFTQIGNLAMWQHRYMLTEDFFARRSMEIHYVLVSAIEARDGARAEWAARAIVDLSRDRILPNLPETHTRTKPDTNR